MKDSWRHFVRRLAAVSIVGGATAWSSAMCYAVQLAFDSASDPVYANGWQGSTTDDLTGELQGAIGDNGGFGFEPWNFDSDFIFTIAPGLQSIDNGLKTGGAGSNKYNDIGQSWRIADPVPTVLGTNGLPLNGLPRAGRGFPALQPGQTLKVRIDNPTQRKFFDGYFIRFNTRLGGSGGGNICYGGDPCSPFNSTTMQGGNAFPNLNIQRFEYFNDGQWVIVNGATPTNSHSIPLFDTDTAAGGADISLTIVSVDPDGTEHYSLTIDPLGSAPTHTETGVLATPGDPIDWIEFTMFNAPTGKVLGDYNDNGTVDAADYTLWRDHRGESFTSVSFPLANRAIRVNQPAPVGTQDYNQWKTRFGDNMPNTDLFIRSMEITSSPGAGGGGGVPEPSTFVYFVTALGSLMALKNAVVR